MGNCVTTKGPKKDPKRLTDEEIKLLLDNTRLTRPQIVALHQNFLKECPTGKLTKKDFIKLFKEVHPSENKKEKADKFCEYVFKVIDQQNLGYITFQEFVLCFSLTSDGEFKDKCEFAFKLYDLDKDGKISKKEMTQVLEALYDLSGITDRKGDKSPAKKVEDIIKAIHAKSALQSIEGPIVINSPALSIAPAASNELSIQVISKPLDSNLADSNAVLSSPTAALDAGEYGKIRAPVITVSTTNSTEEKKKDEKDLKKEKKAKKPEKEEKSKAKESKEEKAAKKEKDKQEKERLKQEKEKEKKEKAERVKQEKEQKEREKKEKAELKKLDRSVKADKSTLKPEKADKIAKETKPSKGSKPSKPEKIEYITKDQFIEACSTDEGLRQLFVDSIFCANPDATISATLGESIAAKVSGTISAAADSINVGLSSNQPSIKTSKFISLSTTSTTIQANTNNDEATITTEKVESKAKELTSDEPKSNETKQITSLEEIIDDLKNQININVNNEKVELNSSS